MCIRDSRTLLFRAVQRAFSLLPLGGLLVSLPLQIIQTRGQTLPLGIQQLDTRAPFGKLRAKPCGLLDVYKRQFQHLTLDQLVRFEQLVELALDRIGHTLLTDD